MSFSSSVKTELVSIKTNSVNKDKAELSALLHLNGFIRLGSGLHLEVTTENPAIARRIISLIKETYNIRAELSITKKKRLYLNHSYSLKIDNKEDAEVILKDTGCIKENRRGTFEFTDHLPAEIIKTKGKKVAFLRGAFLAVGSVASPEKAYHLELVLKDELFANTLKNLINMFGLNAKVVSRKGSFVVYLKEGEHIKDFLTLIGTQSAILEFENVRVLKEMRNSVNRKVNCETANLDKTVSAARRQTQSIRTIQQFMDLEKLPTNLSELAYLRLENEEASLSELADMLGGQTSRSGVNHRFRKLDSIARRLMKD